VAKVETNRRNYVIFAVNDAASMGGGECGTELIEQRRNLA
jgi:hypothetical protein